MQTCIVQMQNMHTKQNVCIYILCTHVKIVDENLHKNRVFYLDSFTKCKCSAFYLLTQCKRGNIIDLQIVYSGVYAPVDLRQDTQAYQTQGGKKRFLQPKEKL